MEENKYNFMWHCKVESTEKSLLLREWAEEASLRRIFKMRRLENEKKPAMQKRDRQEIPSREEYGLCPKDGKECPVRKEQKQEQQDQNVMSNGSGM